MAEPSWYAAQPETGRSPLALPAYQPTVTQTAAGVRLRVPERRSDCSGVRPSWYPFQINVCDAELDPADPDLTPRQMTTDPARW